MGKMPYPDDNSSLEEPESEIRRGLIGLVLGGLGGLIILAALILALYFFVLRPNRPTPGAPGGGSSAAVSTPTAISLPEGVTLPDPPSGIQGKETAVFDVPLTWQDNSDNEDGFHIYRRRLDVLSATEKAGDTHANVTDFLDQGTFCGATYQYTIASFNTAGESPATECWIITLPPCPATGLMQLAVGADYGRSFLTGALGPNADFYLGTDEIYALMFMADLEGQQGLVDLGEIPDVALTHVDLPIPSAWVKDGVPALPGHTYAALARDGQAVIVFDVAQIGNPTELEYIVHYMDYTITLSECPNLTGRQPGGDCVSGDGVCDPTCQPNTAQLDQPVTPSSFTPGPNDFPGTSPNPPAFLAALFPSNYGPDTTGKPSPDYPEPTFTEQDFDCADQPCISGDGICTPDCATGQDFQNWTPAPNTYSTANIAAIYVDSDCGDTPCVTGDGICTPDCVPNPDDPGRQPTNVVCFDTNNDGIVDTCREIPPATHASIPAVYARAIGQIPTSNCQCQGNDLVCDNSVIQNFPTCSNIPACRCDSTTLVCDDGKTYPDHPECADTGRQCRCNGTTLECANQTPEPNSPSCPEGSETPGGSSRLDGDCGGPCEQDGVCVPDCDPFWNPYDDPHTDDPGNDVAGVPATSSYVPNNPDGVPPNATDPDCGPPCTPDSPDLCTCLPTLQTSTLYIDPQRYPQCLPQCACKGSDYVCVDHSGNVIRTAKNAPQCQTNCACESGDMVCRYSDGSIASRQAGSDRCAPICGCEGLDYVCRDRFNQNEVSRQAGAQQCAPASCQCQANDYVCFDAAGNEISRAVEDLGHCGCNCRGPHVYCGTVGDTGIFLNACGCSCNGTTLHCTADNSDTPDWPGCQPQQECKCVCSQTAIALICTDSCTGKRCTP